MPVSVKSLRATPFIADSGAVEILMRAGVASLLNEDRPAGIGHVAWHGRDDHGRVVSSGAYYIRLETDGHLDHRKVMLLK